jgi:hypothetical protein
MVSAVTRPAFVYLIVTDVFLSSLPCSFNITAVLFQHHLGVLST